MYSLITILLGYLFFQIKFTPFFPFPTSPLTPNSQLSQPPRPSTICWGLPSRIRPSKLLKKEPRRSSARWTPTVTVCSPRRSLCRAAWTTDAFTRCWPQTETTQTTAESLLDLLVGRAWGGEGKGGGEGDERGNSCWMSKTRVHEWCKCCNEECYRRLFK